MVNNMIIKLRTKIEKKKDLRIKIKEKLIESYEGVFITGKI